MNIGKRLHVALAQIESERFILDSGPNSETRGPFKVGKWVYATDGHILVAVAAGLLPDVTLSGKHDKAAIGWITESCQPGWTLKSERLKAFAGVDASEPPVCEECDGEGEIRCDYCDGQGGQDCECTDCGDLHTRDCRHCKSCGYIECQACGGKNKEQRYARFCGAEINRAVLAKALRAVGPADGTAIDVVRLQQGAFRLSSPEGWIALVMPLKSGSPITADFDKPETWTDKVDA